jgi:multisubunit Na+/H+ antiporter MnhB subunit
MRRAYLTSTRVLSGIIMLLGLTMIVSALARGGGALALGVVLGTMLALLGAGRLWLARGGER